MSLQLKKYVDDNSTTVINDLTTGGTTDALSAEQGKELNDTKLATTLTDANILIGDGSNTATAQTISGDATLANDGTLTLATDAVDGTNIALENEVAGDMAYYNGTDWVRLAKGTAGQTLVMDATGSLPQWQSGGATDDMEVV